MENYDSETFRYTVQQSKVPSDLESIFDNNASLFKALFLGNKKRSLSRYIFDNMDPIIAPPINKEHFENLSEQEKYVGGNYQYYGHVFRKLKEYNSNTFNFSAFFFTIPWLVYRKMYKESAIALAFMTIISLCIIQVTHIIDTTTSLINTFEKWIDISVIVNLIFAIILGNIANKLYLKKIEKQIANKKSYSSGGTNIITAIVVTYILLYIFFYIGDL